jgi:signal transduction histidine kinase
VIAHTRALVRKSQGEKTPLDIAAVVREILVLIDAEVMRHRIDLRESIGEDIPQILGDRVQLQQVLLNLAMNAIHAMMEVHDRRELGIGVERAAIEEKRGVLVSVRDTGIGVAQENLGRLFEAFYTTKPDGLGMGLPISRSLIQAHGGRLWVTRNADRGTTFQFLLPAWTGPGS